MSVFLADMVAHCNAPYVMHSYVILENGGGSARCNAPEINTLIMED